MAKFILVRDYNDFEKIKDYMSKNRKNNYYIAPELMYRLLASLRYRCVVGLIMDDIKISSHNKIDLITMPVYNKVFQSDAFRVDAVRNYYLRELEHDKEYASIVFGIEEDLKNFEYIDTENISDISK